MDALLDSNFIIACVKRKIDFIKQVEEHGFKVHLPTEVFQELKDLKKKVSHDDRAAIDVAFQLIEQHRIHKIALGGKKSVDQGLIEKGKQGYYIATLDSAIRNVIPNKIGIISAQNRIGVE